MRPNRGTFRRNQRAGTSRVLGRTTRPRDIVHKGSGMTDDPRILVMVPDWDFPSGGVRKLYRHVDILRAHGLNAFVEHQSTGFICNWFEHNTPIADPAESWPPRPQDVLVCPEQVTWQMVK